MYVNNSSDGGDYDNPSSDLDIPLLALVGVLSVTFSLLNLFPITTILRSHRLRNPGNYVFISFFAGGTIQAMIAAPLYLYKRIDHHQRLWVCDAYRMPYFLCSHMMKISLLIISFDRMVTIKYPFKHKKIFTKLNMLTINIVSWVIIIVVDSMPFYIGNNAVLNELCSYIPTKIWSVTVILLFNILPFFFISVNYLALWLVASKVEFKERKQKHRVAADSFQQKPMDSNEMSNNAIDEMDDNEYHNRRHFFMQQQSYIEAVKKNQNKIDLDSRKKTQCDNQVARPTLSTQISRTTKCSVLSLRKYRDLIRFTLELKATKTSLILLFVYMLCWGPLGMFYMIDNFCENCLTEDNKELADARFAVKILCFMSSLFAPLLYCWRTKEFRREVMRMYCHKTYQRKNIESFKVSIGNKKDIISTVP